MVSITYYMYYMYCMYYMYYIFKGLRPPAAGLPVKGQCHRLKRTVSACCATQPCICTTTRNTRLRTYFPYRAISKTSDDVRLMDNE